MTSRIWVLFVDASRAVNSGVGLLKCCGRLGANMRHVIIFVLSTVILPFLVWRGSAQQQNPTASPNAGPGRSLHKNTIISLNSPPIRIEVSEQLRHVGILNFTLKNVAQVERYIYARSDGAGIVHRLFIVQFESVLPGIKGGYSFQVINPTRLSNHDYQTNVGFFNFAQAIASNPGAEAEQTKAFLDRNGLKVDGDFMVARYARITDAEKRHELILFYLENLRDMNLARAELEQGGSRSSEAGKIFNDFAARALRSFRVVDGKP